MTYPHEQPALTELSPEQQKQVGAIDALEMAQIRHRATAFDDLEAQKAEILKRMESYDRLRAIVESESRQYVNQLIAKHIGPDTGNRYRIDSETGAIIIIALKPDPEATIPVKVSGVVPTHEFVANRAATGSDKSKCLVEGCGKGWRAKVHKE